jgi:hypothetical protein
LISNKSQRIRFNKEKLRQPLKVVGVKGENKPRKILDGDVFAE